MRRGVIGLTLLLTACPAQDDEAIEAFCEDAPIVTWDSFGQGFFLQNCQSCHGSEVQGDARNEAPLAVVFDEEDNVLDRRDTVLALAAGDAPMMPPQGGVDADDRYLLEVWLTCWAP